MEESVATMLRPPEQVAEAPPSPPPLSHQPWRPTRKMFVPSVPLVPRPEKSTAASPRMSTLQTNTEKSTIRKPIVTTRHNLKDDHIAQMLRDEAHRTRTVDVFNNLSTFSGKDQRIYDTLGSSPVSARSHQQSDEVADEPIAVPHSARERRMAERLVSYNNSKAVKSLSLPKPRKLEKLKQPGSHPQRKFREVEHDFLVRDHIAQLAEEKEVADALAEAEKQREAEAGVVVEEKKPQWENPSAKLGAHLVQHAQNIVSYTFNLMDATLRRQQSRVSEDSMSHKQTRQVQLVTVLRKNRLEEEPMAPPPAIAVLGRDDRAAALNALREGLNDEPPIAAHSNKAAESFTSSSGDDL